MPLGVNGKGFDCPTGVNASATAPQPCRSYSQMKSNCLPARGLSSDVTEWRLAAKLQVESPVLDIIKNAKASTHHKLRVSENIPRESEPGAKI